jgi:magnesium-transporting ATPase (P-type)
VNAAHRYRKNFFKEEGYLTFSLPVTSQEHIVAKHLSGATMSLLTGVSCLISLCLVVIFSFGENFDFTLGLGGREPLEALEILEKIEQALISILSFVCVFIASGAFCCWEQKFKKRSQIFVRLLILYIAIVVLQSIFAHLGNFGLTEFLYNTVAGGHVRRWLTIFALLGANVFGFWYELHTLKHNLNVK